MKAKTGFFIIFIWIVGWVKAQNNQVVYEYDSIKMESLYKRSKDQRIKNPELSLELGQEFLDMAKTSRNKAKEAIALENLARIFFNIGNYSRTLEYFFEVLQIAEEQGDRFNQAITLNNIGIVYGENGQLEKALEYYNKSLVIKEELGNQEAVANTLSNMGLIHDELGEFENGFNAFVKAFNIDKQRQNISGMFVSLNNIGQNFLKRGIYDSALVYFNRSRDLGVGIDNDYDKAHLLNNIAAAHLGKGESVNAEKYYLQSVSISKNIKARLRLKESFLGLSSVYDAMSDYGRSLEYYKNYEFLKDSLFNEENLKKINEIEADYKIKKKESEINLTKKESEIQGLRQSQTRLVAYLLISCLFLFGTLVFVLYKRNQFKIKANKDLEQKNNEILSKNIDMMDSISYAKSIQESFLPDPGILQRFFSDSFIYYRARDVINGDFFWLSDEEDYLIFAVVDCTGHGVPGALITVMGNSLLNQVVNEKRILYPSEILTELNYRVLNTLNQENYQVNNNEGMDVAIGRFDKGSMKLSFAGAKRPLYYFRNNHLNVIKGDPHSVGGTFYPKDRNYKEHEIYLNKNDTFYVFSDGYTDQFGGENNKKFLPGRFKDLICEIQGEDLEKQREILDRKFRYWKGENEQTDDILIMGVLI